MKSKNKCPLCQSLHYVALFAAKDRMFELPGTFSVVRCRKCLVVFLSPMLSQAQVSAYYPPKKYYAYGTAGKDSFFSKLRAYLIQHYYHPTLLSRILTLMIPKVPAIPTQIKDGKILDVGCGTGETLLLLKDLGWETYGMDIDKKAVTVAKKRGVDHVRVGAYQTIARYPDNFFDAIRLYHVIEHLDDPMRCLRLVRKKLKKRGQLIVGTPNVDSALSKIFGTDWYNVDVPRHLVLFSHHTLQQAVVRSGFSVTRVEFCSAGGLLGSIQYVLREKFGIRWNLIHTQWLVILCYPFEWVIDKIGIGDVFVLIAKYK